MPHEGISVRNSLLGGAPNRPTRIYANKYVTDHLIRKGVGHAVKLLHPEVLFFAEERQKLATITPHALLTDFTPVFAFSGLEVQVIVDSVCNDFGISLSILAEQVAKVIEGQR